MSRYLLCSQSPVKVAAFKQAFGFPPTETLNVDVSVNPEQPVGSLNGLICAKQRIQFALEHLVSSDSLLLSNLRLQQFDYILAIESGIQCVESVDSSDSSESIDKKDKKCYDVVHVVFYDVVNDCYGYALGGGFRFEPELWEKTFNAPENIKTSLGWSLTVGEVVERELHYDQKNWMKDYNVYGRQIDRTDQLASVLKRIIYTGGTGGTSASNSGEWKLSSPYPEDEIRANIRYSVDKPKPGIVFQDLSPVWGSPNLHNLLHECTIQQIQAHLNVPDIDYVVGLESRGFGIAHSLALRLKAGFVMARKPGKQFGERWSVNYGLEYGQSTLELQKDIIEPGSTVLIADDLLATGGSLRACIDLVSNVPDVKILACVTLLRVEDLYHSAKAKLAPIPVITVL